MPIEISKTEVLRYLGHRNQKIDNNVQTLLDESIIEIKESMNPRTIYKEFEINIKDNNIMLKDSNFILKGNSIKNHLKNSKKCILMAFTLGHKVDKLIRYYEKVDMTKALILDSCASTAIEKVADNFCEDLEKIYLLESKKLTSRFSPGYGDLDISIQGEFLNILNAGKIIGLTSTNSNILIPRKSVTAIAGIINKDIEKIRKECKNCNKYNNCIFAKGDGHCGN